MTRNILYKIRLLQIFLLFVLGYIGFAHAHKGNNKDLLIAVDTCVIYKDSIINKPSNIEEAKMNLQLLKSKSHMVVTSIVLKNNNQIICKSRISKVKLRKRMRLTRKRLKYINESSPWDAASNFLSLISDIYLSSIC